MDDITATSLVAATATPTSFLVIPARLASTRLPRKLLLRETGKPLIQHTYEAAQRATRPAGICVACDHREIYDAVRSFGGTCCDDRPQCRLRDRPRGRGRPGDAGDRHLRQRPGGRAGDCGQLDRPGDSAAGRDPDAVMSTLATPIRSRAQLEDPACVKVVFDSRRRALYFSRSPIPHAREWNDGLLAADPPHFYQHVGLYAYRRDFLLRLAQMPQAPLEKLEKLEQLRVLDAGYTILVGVIDEATFGIDTAADYQAFVKKLRPGP